MEKIKNCLNRGQSIIKKRFEKLKWSNPMRGGDAMNTTRIPNRLLNESSPYLQQHAYNPVDWFPWGNEAFDKAKREDKPVFLSIGYS